MSKNGYWYVFADGTKMWAMGMDKVEMQSEVRKHGKLVSKTPA